MKVILHHAEKIVLQEIENGASRDRVAQALALALREVRGDGSFIHWPPINKAILKRWKPSGREYIFRRARGLAEGRTKEC